VKNREELEKIDTSSFLAKDPDFLRSIEDHKLTLTFNKQKLDIKDIIHKVLSATEVIDIDISDDLLENIIKAIYKHGVK